VARLRLELEEVAARLEHERAVFDKRRVGAGCLLQPPAQSVLVTLSQHHFPHPQDASTRNAAHLPPAARRLERRRGSRRSAKRSCASCSATAACWRSRAARFTKCPPSSPGRRWRRWRWAAPPAAAAGAPACRSAVQLPLFGLACLRACSSSEGCGPPAGVAGGGASHGTGARCAAQADSGAPAAAAAGLAGQERGAAGAGAVPGAAAAAPVMGVTAGGQRRRPELSSSSRRGAVRSAQRRRRQPTSAVALQAEQIAGRISGGKALPSERRTASDLCPERLLGGCCLGSCRRSFPAGTRCAAPGLADSSGGTQPAGGCSGGCGALDT
jgi:hypothetical protein